MIKAITDRIRVCLFGLSIAVLGLWSPSEALRICNGALNDPAND